MSIYLESIQNTISSNRLMFNSPLTLSCADAAILFSENGKRYALCSTYNFGGFLSWNSGIPLERVAPPRFVRDPATPIFGGEEIKNIVVRDGMGFVSVLFGILLLGFDGRDDEKEMNRYLAANKIEIGEADRYFIWKNKK